MRKYLLILTTLILASFVYGQVNITFELNMETVDNVDPSGVYIAGGSGFGFVIFWILFIKLLRT